jgi:DNA-binding transcriptional MerR regulator
MEKYRAIPKGFMTVGEVAKKMNTTVRTLQYYDKEGILSPSSESEGGRRLYTDRDIIKLHQIQSMKYIGFSLADIKDRLISLDTPSEVADTLAGQAAAIREKIDSLSEALEAVEKLREETLKMKTVDWKKYADIIMFLQNGADEYIWLVRSLDSKVLEHGWSNFDEEGSKHIISTWDRLCEEIAKLKKSGAAPESEQGQAIAKEWWDMVLDFTGGDMSLLPKLMQFAGNLDNWDEKWKAKMTQAEDFIGKALEVYFMREGYNPLDGTQPADNNLRRSTAV